MSILGRKDRDDTDRNTPAGDHECPRTDCSALARAVHDLTQTIRRAGIDAGGATTCPCADCEQPTPPIVTSDGSVIQGWRIFSVKLQADWIPMLTGQMGTIWPDRKMKAWCRYGHDVAAFIARASEDCGCGIYMLKADPRPAMSYGQMSGPSVTITMTAFAFCVAYGTVLECSGGYRATDVRIEAIWLEDAPTWLIDELAERYGVPIHLIREAA